MNLDIIYIRPILHATTFFIWKADWLAQKLIKQDVELNITITKKEIIKVVLSVTGLIWLAKCAYQIPDLLEYALAWLEKLSSEDYNTVPDFALFNYLIRITLGFLFIFKVGKISSLLLKKISPDEYE